MSPTMHRPTHQHERRTRRRARRATRTTGGCVALVAAVATLIAGAPSADAVIRGTAVPSGKYPWMVALLDATGEQFCGGSVVAPDVIVTAAHCVVDERSATVSVRAGNVLLDHPNAQLRSVKEIRIHPSYSARTDRNDLAVLVLSRPLTYNLRVQPIRLADRVAQASLIKPSAPAVVMGWGSMSDLRDAYPNQLREANLRIVSDASCNTLWGGGIDATSMLCASSPFKADACNGDSGGPLVVQDPVTRVHYQAGVVSFGDTCDHAEVPGVYADLANLGAFVVGRGAGGTLR